MARIGEIVATSSSSLTAASFALHQPPPLGSLVKVTVEEGRRRVYGVVSFGTTAGLDPGRRVVRRSTDDVQDALLVGYGGADGRIYQHLPPQPPPLHYSICGCDADEVRRFSQRHGYFRILLQTMGELPAEQLMAAHIREVYAARGDDVGWLDTAAREVAALLKGEYDRLMGVLQAIDPA